MKKGGGSLSQYDRQSIAEDKIVELRDASEKAKLVHENELVNKIFESTFSSQTMKAEM